MKMLQWLISVWHLTPNETFSPLNTINMYESVFYSGSVEAIPRADATSRGNSDAEWLLAAM